MLAARGAEKERWTRVAGVALAVSIGVGLWLTSRQSYLLFHSLVEGFIVVIAASVFLFSWSSRGYEEQKPFVVLGIGYLFVALIETLHALAYQGMPIFPATKDYATRLWIASRSLEAGVTLAFALGLRRRRPFRPLPSLLVIGAVAAVLIASVFWWDIFPVCYVQGQGVTPFKKAAEYVIAACFLASAVLVGTGPRDSGDRTRRLLVASFSLNILSELAFTLYVDAYGVFNMVGHYLVVASHYLGYQALFATRVQARSRLIQGLTAAKAELEERERELERANASKDKFFSIIAHDLRNPIGGVLNVAELLAKRFDRLDRETIRGLAGSLYEASRRSAELLESILHWARAHTGRIEAHPSEVRLAELCEGVAELYRAPARGKGVRICSGVPSDAVAWADEDMLATVLRNLVSNAVKYTKSGGEVRIRTGGDGTCTELAVEDTGVGMSAEDMAKLFRIDVHFSCPGTAAERGNGLGLILCNELVSLNRGTIAVASTPGAGSSFTVRLPRQQSGAL